MIDLAHTQATAADPLRCGVALIERFTGSRVEPRAAATVQDWVEILVSRLTATQACAVAEHLVGVLPLIDTFFESGDSRLAAVRSGATLGALGLFTPTTDAGWGAAAMVGESAGGAVRVWGEVRIASHAAEGAIVLVHLGDADQRLAWLDHDRPGVEQRGSRTGRPPHGRAARWLVVEGATIVETHVSRPVTVEPGVELYEHLERYAAGWALLALEYARATVRALRRAVRTTQNPGQKEAFSASQLVAMDLTELEIETELTATCATRHFAHAAPSPSGLVVAFSAARTLAAVAAKANELRDHLGLVLEGPLVDDGAATVIAHVGGPLMLENELARALGFGGAFARSTR